MSHSTPASYLVWSILSSLLGVFLVYHLWSFDRFKFVPKPYQLWSNTHKRATLPLYLCISFAWGMEISVCFWLFLMHSGNRQDWFASKYFKIWAVGSAVSVIYLPIITLGTHSNPLKCEAYTFLAGSAGSLFLSIWSISIMPQFTPFLKGLQRDNVDPSVIVRLVKFKELHTIYICCRMMSALPLLILSVDGVRPHQHVDDMIGGFGIAIAAGVALPATDFFPRSIEGEIYRTAGLRSGDYNSHNRLTHISQAHEVQDMYDVESQAGSESDKTSATSTHGETLPIPPSVAWRTGDSGLRPPAISVRLEPNRMVPNSDTDNQTNSAEDNLTRLSFPNQSSSRMSRLVNQFRSPIDIRFAVAPSRR
ncbi:hypothetical protein BC834DRAFT_861791 [Gloeopeniophorella convolvens]|nr:hypothetical protein BC834DRAFT_861791 [Gloeopeniophorella convolvens]